MKGVESKRPSRGRKEPGASEWEVLERRTVYESDRIRVQHLDLRLPDGTLARNYHLLDYPCPAAAVVPYDASGNLLMIRHYRFQTDTTGWEVPAGGVETGETPARAARREMIEETGLTLSRVKKLGRFHPSNGSSNQEFYVFTGLVSQKRGSIWDTNEVIAVKWFTPTEVRRLIGRNEIRDGLSLTALLLYFWGE